MSVLKALSKRIEKNACMSQAEKKAALQKAAAEATARYVQSMRIIEKQAAVGFGDVGQAIAGLPGKAWGHMKNLPGLVTEDLPKYLSESPNVGHAINIGTPAMIGAGIGAATADEGERGRGALLGAGLGAGAYGGAKGLAHLLHDSPTLLRAVEAAKDPKAGLGDRALAQAHSILGKIKGFNLADEVGGGLSRLGKGVKERAAERRAATAAAKPAAEAPKAESKSDSKSDSKPTASAEKTSSATRRRK